ncbi:MAG: hypothetical protein M3Z67_06440 [Commensalibacter sp.]|nr:hypothetical protein [Commensalibacter sp.]
MPFLRAPTPIINKTGLDLAPTVGFRVVIRWLTYIGAALLAVDLISMVVGQDDDGRRGDNHDNYYGGGG